MYFQIKWLFDVFLNYHGQVCTDEHVGALKLPRYQLHAAINNFGKKI